MNTKAKHTPGPWVVEDVRSGLSKRTLIYCRVIPAGRPASDSLAAINVYERGTKGATEEARANAALIASAPTLRAQRDALLLAAEAAEEAFAEAMQDAESEEMIAHWTGLTNLMRAAVQAAKGGVE